jgi:hypothetical protein
MTNPTPKPTVARLDSPAQVVASLPLYLGYTPTESLVVICQHEPRGRMGLTMRFDLPEPRHQAQLVDEAVRRIRLEHPTRLLVLVWTDHPDGDLALAHADLVDDLLDEVEEELRITDAMLVRDGRFWSYLCGNPRCCPPEGTPVGAARADQQVRVIEAARVLQGRAPMADRNALERSLSGPTFLAAEQARQQIAQVGAELAGAWSVDRLEAMDELIEEWEVSVAEFADDPGSLTDEQAARLAVSLEDRLLRDSVACAHEPQALLPLLAELCRRTPDPFDAPVATLFAWMAYLEGGGAEVTIALDRAQRTDPGYSMAGLLRDHLDQQTDPAVLRRVTQETARELPAARRRARRSRRSPGSAS